MALPGGAEQILLRPASALYCCLDWLTHGSGRAGLAAGRAPRASTDAVGRYECRVEQSSRSPAEATKRREDKASLVSTASQETRGSRAVLMAAKGLAAALRCNSRQASVAVRLCEWHCATPPGEKNHRQHRAREFRIANIIRTRRTPLRSEAREGGESAFQGAPIGNERMAP